VLIMFSLLARAMLSDVLLYDALKVFLR